MCGRLLPPFFTPRAGSRGNGSNSLLSAAVLSLQYTLCASDSTSFSEGPWPSSPAFLEEDYNVQSLAELLGSRVSPGWVTLSMLFLLPITAVKGHMPAPHLHTSTLPLPRHLLSTRHQGCFCSRWMIKT